MPQNEGSSECEDPSELPSDGESLKEGSSNCLVRTVGFLEAGAPLHAAPLQSSGADFAETCSASTLSSNFDFRRLLCEGDKKAFRPLKTFQKMLLKL